MTVSGHVHVNDVLERAHPPTQGQHHRVRHAVAGGRAQVFDQLVVQLRPGTTSASPANTWDETASSCLT